MNNNQIHKPLIAIVGPSGSGKSTSLRNLSPATTIILDGERKGFPFRGIEQFKVFPFENQAQHDDAFKKALDMPGTELIVVESLTKLFEQIKTLCQRSFKGFDIYGNYSKMVLKTLNDYKNTKATVVVTSIDDIVDIESVDGSKISKRMIAVDGKEQRGKLEKEFLMVFFTEPRKNKSGNMEYWFQTNTDGTTTAKTPMDMFKEQLIANDMAACLKRMNEHFSSPISA